jgi:hypothetical protein
VSWLHSKKKDEKKPDATTTTTTTDPNSTTTTTTTTTSSDVPKFSDPEVQQYVDDYTAFVTSIVAAYKSKNATDIAQLSGKMSDWSSRSMSVGQKLAGNAEEATKFSNYVTKLSQEMTAAMTGK